MVHFQVGIVVTALLVVLVSVFINLPSNKIIEEPVDLQSCEPFLIRNISGECFFRDNYNDARELFLKSAKDAGAELMFLRVVDDLGTDVAVLRGTGESKRFLIHLSGIHGAEGYAGSAVQSAALMSLGQTTVQMMLFILCFITCIFGCSNIRPPIT